MNAQDLERFYHQHCRFKLRSGKEVFGVIWPDKGRNNLKIVFSSVYNHDTFFDENKEIRDITLIDKNEIIYAENMV